MMNREYKHSSVGSGKFQFNFSCTRFKKRYQFNQGQPNMWPRLQGKQTPTTQSDQYISLILSFRHEKYETMSDLWHQPFITRLRRSYQMNEGSSARSGTSFSCLPPFLMQTLHHFLSRCFLSPYILFNLPSSQINPDPPSSSCIRPCVCALVGRAAKRWLMRWVFPWVWYLLESEHRQAFLWLDWMISATAAAR